MRSTSRKLHPFRRLTRELTTSLWRSGEGGTSPADPTSPLFDRLFPGQDVARSVTPISSGGNGPLLHARQIPPKEEERLRFFSLNVAHGRRHTANRPYLSRRTAQRNLHQIAEVVKEVTPDVVALQEADGPSAWSGNFDHVAALAEKADLLHHYRGEHNAVAVGRFNVTYGTALLARQPLLEPASHRFGVSWHDTKGFVVATIVVPEWGDLPVDVVSVHLDFLVPNVRRRQIQLMVEQLAARRRPLVVLGDLNCCFQYEPKSMEMLIDALGLRAYEPHLRAPTFPARRPWRRIDWILVSDQLDFSGYHTVPMPLSDHLVLIADLHLRQ